MRRLAVASAAVLIGVAVTAAARADDTVITIVSDAVRADDLTFDVRLDTDTEISGTFNDIAFAPPTLIDICPNGRPSCQVDDFIEKGATSFAFLPFGCTPGVSCTGLRALVLSIDNVSPIRSGSVLYTCRLAADTPPGRHELQCIDSKASDPSGAEVTTTCIGGEVEVTPRAATSLARARSRGWKSGSTRPRARTR